MDLFFPRARLQHQGGERVEAVVQSLDRTAIAISPIGSRVTCVPAPVDTDEDWLILVTEDPTSRMKELGFTQDGSPDFYTGNDQGGFRSWRKGDLNVVTTPDGEFYRRFMTATHLAKRYNLLDKGDRIALFQAILYNVDVNNLQRSDAEIQTELARYAIPSDEQTMTLDSWQAEPFGWLVDEDGDIDSMLGRRQHTVRGLDEVVLHAFDDVMMTREPLIRIEIPAEGLNMGELEDMCFVEQEKDGESRLGRRFSNWGSWITRHNRRTLRLRMGDVSWEKAAVI